MNLVFYRAPQALKYADCAIVNTHVVLPQNLGSSRRMKCFSLPEDFVAACLAPSRNTLSAIFDYTYVRPTGRTYRCTAFEPIRLRAFLPPCVCFNPQRIQYGRLSPPHYSVYQQLPRTTKKCHCAVCQNWTGAPYQWMVLFPVNRASVVKGAENIQISRTSDALDRARCKASIVCTG